MTWVAAGAAVVGVVASNQAANKQAEAANKASSLSNAAMGQSRADMMPYMQTGLQGNEMLGAYMGFDAPQLSREELYKQLAPQYTTSYKKEHKKGGWYGKSKLRKLSLAQTLTGQNDPRFAKKLNKNALNKAVDEAMAKQAQNLEARRNDPNFGMLTKRFTNEDFVKDPGYDFRQAQGELGVNRNLATRGKYFSGAAMKELDRYNQDFASNEFGNAYNRDTAFKANMYNRLAGMAQGGQATTQYMSGMNINNAAGLGQNEMAGAQAQGAGYMGMANALAQGAGSAVNQWQTQKYLDSLKNKTV